MTDKLQATYTVEDTNPKTKYHSRLSLVKAQAVRRQNRNCCQILQCGNPTKRRTHMGQRCIGYHSCSTIHHLDVILLHTVRSPAVLWHNRLICLVCVGRADRVTRASAVAQSLLCHSSTLELNTLSLPWDKTCLLIQVSIALSSPTSLAHGMLCHPLGLCSGPGGTGHWHLTRVLTRPQPPCRRHDYTLSLTPSQEAGSCRFSRGSWCIKTAQNTLLIPGFR